MGLFDDILGKKDDKTPAAKPDFGNVTAGGSSTAPSAPAAPGAPEPPVGTTGSAKTYVVVRGDSLSKIAKREYGDASKWHRIYDANRDVIKDPDLIYPGQELKVPSA
jgi:nucleoid-associated protein YgaU